MFTVTAYKARDSPLHEAAMNFLKAFLPGSLLTWIVASIVGRDGDKGGMLNIQHTLVDGHTLHWSWPLFLVATGLTWALLAMME